MNAAFLAYGAPPEIAELCSQRDMTAQHARNCKVESELWALREIAARARLKRMDEELKARGWL